MASGITIRVDDGKGGDNKTIHVVVNHDLQRDSQTRGRGRGRGGATDKGRGRGFRGNADVGDQDKSSFKGSSQRGRGIGGHSFRGGHSDGPMKTERHGTDHDVPAVADLTIKDSSRGRGRGGFDQHKKSTEKWKSSREKDVNSKPEPTVVHHHHHHHHGDSHRQKSGDQHRPSGKSIVEHHHHHHYHHHDQDRKHDNSGQQYHHHHHDGHHKGQSSSSRPSSDASHHTSSTQVVKVSVQTSHNGKGEGTKGGKFKGK